MDRQQPNLICSREGCPVEAVRRQIQAWTEAQIKAGVAPSKAAYEHILTCTTCHQARGWQRRENGKEYAIPDLIARAAVG